MKLNKNYSKDTNLDKIYLDGSYLNQNQTWHSEDSQWKSEQIENLLKRNSIIPESICEVGCGAGEVLNQLSNIYIESQLTGFEVSPQAFELSKSRESRRVHFVLGDIFDNYDNYDILLCLDVFEHVPDYLGFISNLRKRARYKVFHVPLDISVLSVLANRMTNSRASMGHLHYFTAQSALNTIEDCGYKIIDSFYTQGFLRHSRSRKFISRLALFPRKLLYFISPDFSVRIFGGCSLIILAE
jgi:hypothetical protein